MAAQKPRPAVPASRRPSVAVQIGKVKVGGGAPVVVQSMTNTDTEDPASTAKQIAELARAGSELRSEEHTSELQSLMRISYAVFCLKKKNNINKKHQRINIIHD